MCAPNWLESGYDDLYDLVLGSMLTLLRTLSHEFVVSVQCAGSARRYTGRLSPDQNFAASF